MTSQPGASSLRTVVIINDYASVNGGAAKVAIESACGLAGAGWNVCYVAAVGPADERLRLAGVRVVITDQPDLIHQSALQGMTMGLWNRAASQQVTQLFREYPPGSTVIHVHGWVKALTGSVVRAAIESGHPVTMTLHDYFLACPNGGWHNYSTQQQCALTPLSPSCLCTQCDKRGYHHKLWRVLRQVGNASQGIPGQLRHTIAVSAYSAKLLRPYLSPDAAMEIIPNPIVADRLPPAKPSQSQSFLFIGRLEPEKGGVLLAHAARKAGVHVRFVGQGPEEDRIKSANPQAEFCGWLSPREVIDEIRRAWALVLPSLWHETQGMVVAEAAAQGIPAIVPDRCAAAEMVTDQINGLHFTSGSESSLIRALKALHDDKLTDNLGDAAYQQFWTDPPTLARHVEALDSHYRVLLGEQVPGSIERKSLTAALG